MPRFESWNSYQCTLVGGTYRLRHRWVFPRDYDSMFLPLENLHCKGNSAVLYPRTVTGTLAWSRFLLEKEWESYLNRHEHRR